MRRSITTMIVTPGVLTAGLVTILLLTACSPASSSAAGMSTGLSSSSPSSIDGMVDIGSGRRIHATCAGFDQGGPTVVFVSGSRSAGDEWTALPKAGNTTFDMTRMAASSTAVFGQVSAFAPTCAYDRPGTFQLSGSPSPSTRVAQPTSAAAGVADLHAWLTAAAVAPPYVLVGHSWGGMIATLYAATYPSSTAGLVLVDPATAFLKDALTPAQWQDFLGLSAGLLDGSGTEVPDYANSVDAVRVARVGRIPMVVLTSDQPFDIGIGLDAFPSWLSASDSFAKQLGAPHVTDTNSGHDISIENPDLVVSSIRQVLDQVG